MRYKVQNPKKLKFSKFQNENDLRYKKKRAKQKCKTKALGNLYSIRKSEDGRMDATRSHSERMREGKKERKKDL